MKRFMFAAIAIVALAGCTKNEVAEVKNDSPISFQTVVGTPSTKAMVTGTGNKYELHDPTFGTQAYYNAAGTTFPTGAGLYIPESEVKPNTPNAGEWSTTQPYYWPKEGSGYLTFYSYSPYEINAYVEITDADGVKISNYNVADRQDTDVMVADMATNQTGNGTNGGYNGVPTVFRHKLAQVVKFEFLTDADYNSTLQAGALEFFINKVSINNIYYLGTYTSGNDVNASNIGWWASDTSYDKDYVWFEQTANTTANQVDFGTANDVIGGGEASIEAKGYLLVLPQIFGADAEIAIEYSIFHYTDATNYTVENAKGSVKLSDLHKTSAPWANAWNMNKKISYTITIGPGERILWAPSVEPWTDDAL